VRCDLKLWLSIEALGKLMYNVGAKGIVTPEMLKAETIVLGPWRGWDVCVKPIIQLDLVFWIVLFICKEADLARYEVPVYHIAQLAWELVAYPVGNFPTNCPVVLVDEKSDFRIDITVVVEVSLDLSK
jgi:hypothetical protein